MIFVRLSRIILNIRNLQDFATNVTKNRKGFWYNEVRNLLFIFVAENNIVITQASTVSLQSRTIPKTPF